MVSCFAEKLQVEAVPVRAPRMRAGQRNGLEFYAGTQFRPKVLPALSL